MWDKDRKHGGSGSAVNGLPVLIVDLDLKTPAQVVPHLSEAHLSTNDRQQLLETSFLFLSLSDQPR